MPVDTCIQALRDASPRNQPGFEESIARCEMLRDQITATLVPSRARSPRVASRGRLVSLSTAAAAAVALVAVLVGLGVTASSPSSAFAAARRALAATAAATSGTMTMTTTAPDGTSVTMESTLWNGDDIAFSTGASDFLGSDRRLLLIGGGAYVQEADGHWVRYVSESEVGYKVGPKVQLAHDNVAGNTAQRILDLATGLKKTEQLDGSTLYTATIPNSTADPGNDPADDALMRMLTDLRTGKDPGAPSGSNEPLWHTDLQLKMTVASDGLVRQMSLIFRPLDPGSSEYTGPTTWSVTYSHLGSTPPITAPRVSTPGTPVIVTPSVAPAGPHGG
jgi:hypothetical protein